jgi:hypothetical protein
MMTLVSVPQDLLIVIASFLLAKEEQNMLNYRCSRDWRNFLNTRKEYVQWKKQSQVLSLKADKLITSSRFREQIMKSIKDPLNQLELHCSSSRTIASLSMLTAMNKITVSHCTIDEYPTNCHELTLISCKISRFPNGYSLRKLWMSSCRMGPEENENIDVSCLNIQEAASFTSINLQNYHLLKDLRSVSISSCPSIIDVSCFKNVSILSFYACANIIDVSSLGNVNELTLALCQGVKDVVALGSVYKLNLSQSIGFSDISSLKDVHSLDLKECTPITDVSALKNVQELHLHGFRGTDLSGLKNVKKLFISYSFPVSDVSALATLKELDINNCPLITNFRGMINLRSLRIIVLDLARQLTKFFPIEPSGLEIVRNLTFVEAVGVIFEGRKLNHHCLSFAHLNHIHTMELFRCEFSQFPEGELSEVERSDSSL